MSAGIPSIDRVAPQGRGLPIVPWLWIGLLLVAFPLLHVVRSAAWHAVAGSGRASHQYYVPFWVTVVLLQALSVVLVVQAMRAAGGTLADLGLRVATRQAALTVALLVAVGVVLIIYREFGPPAVPPTDAFSRPVTMEERAIWLLASLSAAFSEELLYRGFAITALQGRGIWLPVAVAIALVPWILNHGLTGLDRVVFYVVSGLVFTAIYLWRRILYPGMVVHALVNLAVLTG